MTTDRLAETPAMRSLDERIALAQRCRDCDDIPKVLGAGTVHADADGTPIQLMHNGLRVLAGGYYGDWMTRLITLCRGHHEPQEERLFHEVLGVLPPDATMIELGGFWAYYTAWFLQHAPGRRAIVLEPDPAHRAIGETNLALNGLDAAFMAGFAGAGDGPPAPFATEASGTILLPCFGVDGLLAMHGIDRLDLLHCDTQGAEFDVLTGACDLFRAGRVGWVFASTHVHHISGDPLTHLRCLALLQECGAVIEAEHNPYESYSGDGLIVARFGPAPAGWRPVPISIARQSEALFREPVFDLAAAFAQRRAAVPGLPDRVVSGLFDTLLFRPADPAGLAFFTDQLNQSGDVGALVRSILQSPEFQAREPQFAAAYFGGGGTPIRGAMTRTGVRLVLDRDGPLGRAGQTLLVPDDRVILPALLAAGGWNTQHLAMLADRIDPARIYTLIDIGANIGLFARQVLQTFGNVAACHCIEPDPGNFDALRYNLADYPGVQMHPFGLGAADGTARFFRDRENCGNHSVHADAMRDRPFT
ncbi:MAG: FkbM family methyltransferase, partial [Gemmatimonadaceae bacterium]|nr:FkbM family methyltransferase [Acetobacteraceae bacterium]